MPPEKVDDGPEEPAVKPLDEDDIHLLKNYVVPLRRFLRSAGTGTLLEATETG